MSAGRRKRGVELSAAYKKSSAEWHQQKEKPGWVFTGGESYSDFYAVQDRCRQVGKCGKIIMAQPSAHKNVQKGQVIVKIKLEAKTAEDGQERQPEPSREQKARKFRNGALAKSNLGAGTGEQRENRSAEWVNRGHDRAPSES